MNTVKTGSVIAVLALGAMHAMGSAAAELQATDGTTSGSTLASGDFGIPMQGNDLSDLETRRRMDAIKADFPRHKATFKQMCGGDVDIDVDWASFGHDKQALMLIGTVMGIERLVDAFQDPCRDKAGRDAVKAKIWTIRAVNVTDASTIRAGVAGGVFTAQLNWSGTSPGMSENDLAQVITKAL